MLKTQIMAILFMAMLLVLGACAPASEPKPFPPPEGYSSWDEYYEEHYKETSPTPAPEPAPTPEPAPIPTPEPTPTTQVTTEWITPISAEASGYTVWGETWYTGPPELAIDGNDITAWTLNDMGEITFDLGSKRVVTGIEVYWGGHVTNGNTVNVFVENTQVLQNERFGATSNEIYFNSIQGRYIKYETVPLPHNEFLQIATWSEIAEFRVLVELE